MKRLWLAVFGLCALGGAVFTSGCGPGLVALGGGGTGTFFGLQGGDEKKKKDDPPAGTTNVIPAIVITNLVRSETPATINYSIIDANNDLCDIDVEFSVGGGAFATATEGTGGDGVTGLGSSAGGTPHAFAWDFDADLGPQATSGVSLRIRANDGTVTGTWFELQNQLIGNDAPEIIGIMQVGVDPSVPSLLTFTLTDASSDLCTFEVAYSINQGTDFIEVQSAEYFGNPPVDMSTSPGGTANQFIWDSSVALPDYVGDVTLRITPTDQPSGYTGITEGLPVQPSFSVQNVVNDPPEVTVNSIFDGTAYTAVVPISVTISDDEFDTAVLVTQFTVDDGANWFTATMRTQFSPGIVGPFGTNPPETKTIYWEALTDFADINKFPTYVNEYNGTVRLRFIAADAVVNPNFEVTDLFSVTGNTAPEVFEIEIFQDSGNIPVAVTLIDTSSHPVNLYGSVSVEVSVDGTNYINVPQSDFVFGNPTNMPSSPVGVGTALIWDTTPMFDGSPFQLNEASVTLRITPTDQPAGTPVAAHLSGPSFTSDPFPVINDASGTDPISITIVTTDAGPPEPSTNLTNEITVVPGGTVYLFGVVNPSTTLIDQTFWKIAETGDDFGTLSDPYTSAGTMQFATGSLALSPPGTGAGFAEDGETFVIDDGLNGPLTLEFDTNSLVSITGNVPVDISAAATDNDVAVAVADVINNRSDIRIQASVSGVSNFINLTHEFACRLGNASGAGSNATPISQTGDALIGLSDMSGGAGTDWVRYDAPATPPSGSDYVSLFCEIDDPGFFQTVFRSYRLYWGDAPTSVDVTPLNQTILEDEQVQFSATVLPAGAPQIVEWSVTSGLGSIDPDTGLYTAPSSVSGETLVEVQAKSVNPLVTSIPPSSPSFMVKVLPHPQSIDVTTVSWGGQFAEPDLEVSQAGTPIVAEFDAQVFPTGAPQGVVWRIFWNGASRGGGDTTVGTVDQTGLYTAPLQLPSSVASGTPNDLFVDAISTVDGSVFGFAFIRLKAPPPTSFDVTPSSATVTAGGAGQQFDVTNFMPSNANKSVTWSVNPQVGSINPSTGFYTPPPTNPGQVITVRAVSNANGAIDDTASLTINPATGGSPTGVTISQIEGIVLSGGTTTLTASVAPGTVNQAVTWTVLSPTFGASIGVNSGVFSAPTTSVDRVVTVRCDTVATPSLSDTIDVCITGSGQNWTENGNFLMGRGDASFIWDDNNDVLWVVGGHSATSRKNGHIRKTFYMEDSGGYEFYEGPTIDSLKAGNLHPNTITAVYDDDNKRLIAVLGNGPTNNVEVWELDVSAGLSGTWSRITAGGTGVSVPKLGGSYRYHSWWEPNDKIMYVLSGRNTLFRFDTSANIWTASKSVGDTGNGPANPELTAFAWNGSTNDIHFVGASDGTVSATCENFRLERLVGANFRWKTDSQSGTVPVNGIVNPAAYRHNDDIYLFGGRPSNSAQPNSDLYEISFSGGTYNWQLIPPATDEERPAPRIDAAFADGPGGPLLFGGETVGANGGTFGDVWQFDEGKLEFSIANPTFIKPQGRLLAAGAWATNEGLTYGGLCDHGPSNELWAVNFSGSTPDYQRIATTGERPPALVATGSTYIDVDDAFVIFGGFGNNDVLWDEVYAFDTQNDTWTRIVPTAGPRPSARWGASLCYDQSNDRIWLFGGESGGSTLMDDLWYLDISSAGIFGTVTWNEITVAGGSPLPDKRKLATIGYDETYNRLLMLGGEIQSGGNQQLYEFDIAGNAWATLNVTNPGNGNDVFASGAVYDDDCSRFVHLPPLLLKADALVITTNGPTWQNLLSPTVENNATGSTGFYDAVNGRYYSIFGEKFVDSVLVGTNIFRTFSVK